MRWCVECREETVFAQPPCADGHVDCPELMCLVCGAAVILLSDVPAAEVAIAVIAA
jgi:hypothetical protein